MIKTDSKEYFKRLNEKFDAMTDEEFVQLMKIEGYPVTPRKIDECVHEVRNSTMEELFEAGRKFKDALGLTDQDVYENLKRNKGR